MNIKLLTEHHLEGGCTGSSESNHVKMSHCWKSHVATHMLLVLKRMVSISTKTNDKTDGIENIYNFKLFFFLFISTWPKVIELFHAQSTKHETSIAHIN